MGTTINTGIVSSDSDYLKVTEAVSTQSELDKDTFINLLVTQMKYQDPLEPVDNSEMLAQLAQFTALEQMMNVAQTGQKQLANGMIGKHVEYVYTDSKTGVSEYLVGKVDYVTIKGDTPTLGIGGVEVSLDDVYQIVDSSNIEANTTAFQLLGKTVQGTIEQTNAEGKKEDIIIEGEVLGISMKEGNPFLVIGTGQKAVEVDFNNVQNIVDVPSITGKNVTGTIADKQGNKTTVTGEAEYVLINTAGTYVYVDGQFIDFNNIDKIQKIK